MNDYSLQIESEEMNLKDRIFENFLEPTGIVKRNCVEHFNIQSADRKFRFGTGLKVFQKPIRNVFRKNH